MSITPSHPPSPLSTPRLSPLSPTTHPPSQPGRIIAQPPHRRERSYIAWVRLQDRVDYQSAKALMRELLPRELDVLRTWGQQVEGAKERLIDKVVDAYPTFAKYEKAWPILYYGIQYHGDMRRPISSAFKRRRQCPSALATDPDFGMPLPCINEYKSRQSAHVRQFLANRGRSNQPRGPCSATPPSRVTPASEEHHDCSATATLGGGAQGVIADDPAQGKQEVLHFLLAVNGTFGCLLDRFWYAGITSKARLLAMALEWTDAEREEFLLKAVHADPFERKMLSGGLAKVVSGNM